VRPKRSTQNELENTYVVFEELELFLITLRFKFVQAGADENSILSSDADN
jgi:hypothetical protein